MGAAFFPHAAKVSIQVRHKNKERNFFISIVTSITSNLLAKPSISYTVKNSKRQDTTTIVIPCLYLFRFSFCTVRHKKNPQTEWSGDVVTVQDSNL